VFRNQIDASYFGGRRWEGFTAAERGGGASSFHAWPHASHSKDATEPDSAICTTLRW
jgi:hypothetical protein